MAPFLLPHSEFVAVPEEADFALAMNNDLPDYSLLVRNVKRANKPVVWWTIDDPNFFHQFIGQATLADVVFTTDAACIGQYQKVLDHNRILWLPLACSPTHHVPLPLTTDATEYVVSANWYVNEARSWSAALIVDPLVEKGRSLSLYCYQREPFMWPSRYRSFWRGQDPYLTVARQYQHGRVALSLANQRSGLDGRRKTYMTSMRTFEALACGKPLLAPFSDAFERLGFKNREHLIWVTSPSETPGCGEILLSNDGLAIASAGRSFVLERHTYRHRLNRIREVIAS